MTEQELRTKFVAVAESYLGANEKDGTHRPIIDVYNSHRPLARGYLAKYTDDWCDIFVSAISILTGLTEIIPTECGCGEHIKLFQKLGSWQEDETNYVPQIGDVIFYDWGDGTNYATTDNRGGAEHVGIVAKVTGNMVRVVEGNYRNGVGYRDIALNGRYIRGYAVPDFAKLATAPPAPTQDDDPPLRFNTIAEIRNGADYAVDTVKKLVALGAIRGSGAKDANGFPADMDLSRDMLRVLVMCDRAGAYGK